MLVHWLFLMSLDWSFLADSKWSISPGSNNNRMPTCFICNESIYLCINRNFYLHYLEQDLQAIAYKRKDEGKKDIAKAHYELVTAYVEFFKILIDDIAVQGD